VTVGTTIGFGRVIDGDITGVDFEIEKELFDQFAFVARTQNKIIEPKVCVVSHDVPNNRERPNWDHGFG
jgi:hypothetical protein